MERRIEERVDSWESRRFTDGYDELRELASAEFSGAIDAAGTQIFMLNGRVIGAFEGRIEDLEHAEGTVYRAPHPSVALLYTMQLKGGETRAQYYTEETPLREVDSTLSDGSFTGYIELSENVLSGDYYFAYYGGRAMHAAFVGTKEELVTDDEAFQKATDEVGIYEVVDVDIEITEIPSGEDDAAAESAESTQSRSGADTQPEQQERSGAVGQDQPVDDQQPPSGDRQQRSEQRQPNDQRSEQRSPADQQSPSADQSQPRTNQHQSNEQQPPADQQRRAEHQRRHAADDRTNDRQPSGDGRTAEPAPDSHREPPDQSDTEPRSASSNQSPPADRTESGRAGRHEEPRSDVAPEGTSSSPDVSNADRSSGEMEPRGNGATERPDRDHEANPGTRPSSSTDEPDSSPFDEEAAWREADTIPSLDPDRTASPGGANTEPAETSDQQAVDRSRNERREHAEGATAGNDVEDAFDAEILEREDRIDRLTQRVANLEAERDDLKRERDELAGTVDQLREENATLEDELSLLEDELERLEHELETAQSGGGGRAANTATATTGGGSQQLTKADALSGTDLFVRYDSKSEATLEDAHAGNAEPEEVNGNLRLEQHTRFEAADVTVDGRPYEAFLEETLEYRFVEWFVTMLPYEIRDTGHVDALQDLYDAYPEIDRAELDGSVSIEYTEDGEEIREQVTFDIVIRDRMGNPLVVANINDQRDPASEEMMVQLNEDAMRVKESSDSLGAAVLVTKSFFSPGALETAAEATGGSFLSRDSRESFVKLSRKRGYHLCLIEARGDDFHLNEPDL